MNILKALAQIGEALAQYPIVKAERDTLKAERADIEVAVKKLADDNGITLTD